VSFYVRRTKFVPCPERPRLPGQFAPARCPHQPRCQAVEGGVLGRAREGWTGPIRSEHQADREVAAWQSVGWTAERVPSTRDVQAQVRAGERSRR
jgi:hypothetical protein